MIAFMAHAWSPPPELRVFLTAGVLGALTTFSTFAMDVAYLTGRRAFTAAAVYTLASVGLLLGGFFTGLTLALPLQAVTWSVPSSEGRDSGDLASLVNPEAVTELRDKIADVRGGA